jgi:hypothetical protein
MGEEGDTYVIEAAATEYKLVAQEFSRRLLHGDARDRRRQARDQDAASAVFDS